MDRKRAAAMVANVMVRQSLKLLPDPRRVVVRPFKPTIEPRNLNPTDRTRVNHIVDRVVALGILGAKAVLSEVLENFQGRHRDLSMILEARALEVATSLDVPITLDQTQLHLLGAYFLMENSFEAAALFNPSIVLHPDQAQAPPGGFRFILSLRALGEGHVSCLTFRAGSVDAHGFVRVDDPSRLAAVPMRVDRRPDIAGEAVELAFDPAVDISERVVFPVTLAQSNGIEDARFVRFEDEGAVIFYATYTAYSGRGVRSELLSTEDFVSFRLSPLQGAASINKGMALFPRKIGGRYAMIARQDNENLYLLYSDDIFEWEAGAILLQPADDWEFVQIGNCGSPVELDEGWLLLTHGVGPMRRYSIGAVLLDKADPSRVIGRLIYPLIGPELAEREGYVPNVVYTCGAIRHGALLIVPYAVSDTFTTFATVEISALLQALVWVVDGI